MNTRPKPQKHFFISSDQIDIITCPRCKGEQDDPCSQEYFREFSCTLCKGGGKIWMVKPEYILGRE